jgi:NAD(P)-dependent dehydrogenase (short-subunit alcohol dehydrogenase family)
MISESEPAAGHPFCSLAGKTALITGGGSGIGQAIAVEFARGGAKVIILELNESGAHETMDKIASLAGSADRTVRVIVGDVSDTASMAAAWEGVDALDILVNNAGIAHVGNVEQTSPEELDRLYRVNVKGVYHCLHFGIPKLKAQSGAAILNIASIASKIGIEDRFAYSMTKGAVLSMTLSVARDYVAQGIRCNCICPARVHTPFVDGFVRKNYPGREEEALRRLGAYQPIGRMGEAPEIAKLTRFLCSDDAAFITGSAYDIDGGVTLLR